MSLKIMIVDDEPAVLKLFKTIVEPHGFEVLTLTDSGEAARRLEKEKFDGVFVDAQMSHPDGFELTQCVRASRLNSRVPIVMFTGYDDVEAMRKGFHAGVTCFIGKPVTHERLYGVLKTMRGSMLREKRRYARLPYRTAVTCRSGSQLFESQSVNIGEEGLLLEKSGGAKVDQELDLEFSTPGAPQPLKLRAKVVRKEPPDRIAVQFLALKSPEREAIQSYIAGNINE